MTYLNPGRVYLVGAGPGDPDLMTVRGLNCLRRADLVVYDRLVSEALLDEAPLWAERIFVGKGPGWQVLSQDEINALIVTRAQAGQVVVRLKGGDPFVFGRGGEEALACAEAGVPCEIVPGISSAIGVPGMAGIPVTHRNVSGAFAVVTAHRADDTANDVDWSALARIDTLVILMGVERLGRIVTLLTQYGRPATTPVAIIENGASSDERITVGTLADIADQAQAVGVRSPAVIVVGEVVRVREKLAAYLTRDVANAESALTY